MSFRRMLVVFVLSVCAPATLCYDIDRATRKREKKCILIPDGMLEFWHVMRNEEWCDWMKPTIENVCVIVEFKVFDVRWTTMRVTSIYFNPLYSCLCACCSDIRTAYIDNVWLNEREKECNKDIAYQYLFFNTSFYDWVFLVFFWFVNLYRLVSLASCASFDIRKSLNTFIFSAQCSMCPCSTVHIQYPLYYSTLPLVVFCIIQTNSG